MIARIAVAAGMVCAAIATTSSFSNPRPRVFHDDDAEVYINGEHARALRAGRNTIAVHVHNTRGAQFIDLGLVDVK